MEPYPQTTPPTGQQVEIQVTTGSVFTAIFDGVQFWVGINDDPNDLPVANDYVTGWRLL